MKKSLILLLFPILTFSQVGIETTTPTETLDVNGTARVRSLTDGTVQSSSTGVLNVSPYKVKAMGVIAKNATVYKQFGFSSIVSLGAGRYRFTFITPMPDNNYIINGMAQGRTVSYDNVLTNSFELVMSSNVGAFDFNVVIFEIN